MKLHSESFRDGGPIPAEFAFADIDPGSHVRLAGNRNPHLAWSNPPAGTRSFAIVCHDPDVPSRPDDVNKEGREVQANLPRVTFFHWLLLDIPADNTEVVAGGHSDGVSPRGKSGPAIQHGMRHGVNDYTGWFTGDAEMEGTYFGYDGPCPPWNDTIVHHYVFTVYALDVPHLTIRAPLSGVNVMAAIEPHILDKAWITGLYALNPGVRRAMSGNT